MKNMYEDENHIIKIALDALKTLSLQNKHPRLADRCDQLQAKFTCNPDTVCSHNMQAQGN